MARTGAVPDRDEDAFRVAVVDDSTVARGLLTGWIRGLPGIEMVGVHDRAQALIDTFPTSAPDLVILDLEMPDMDGITALALLRDRPDTQVIVVTGLDTRRSDITGRCLSLGAADVLEKPSTVHGPDALARFRRALVSRIEAIAASRRQVRRVPEGAPAREPSPRIRLAPPPAPAHQSRPQETEAARPPLARRRDIVLIGASTGGPRAIVEVLRGIAGQLGDCITVVAQHMPQGFIASFAGHLGIVAGRPVTAAVGGEILEPGGVFVLPSGVRTEIGLARGQVRLVAAGPDDGLYRPSFSRLIGSVAQAGLARHAVAVALTGMGNDGASAAGAFRQKGGLMLAQDAATSVVWGMPGAIAAAGDAHEVLPLPEIGPRLARLLTEGRA